jgi:hypothetical protein
MIASKALNTALLGVYLGPVDPGRGREGVADKVVFRLLVYVALLNIFLKEKEKKNYAGSKTFSASIKKKETHSSW